jgi:hypothetical protein
MRVITSSIRVVNHSSISAIAFWRATILFW